MVQSDNLVQAVDSGINEEAAEIDRIMEQIEDLEKKMETEPAVTPDAKVIPMHPAERRDTSGAVESQTAHSISESLVETDAPLTEKGPLLQNIDTVAGDGSLSLKVGQCSEISLEFARSGITITLSYNEDGLCISTDQGAEFRLPLKKAA